MWLSCSGRVSDLSFCLVVAVGVEVVALDRVSFGLAGFISCFKKGFIKLRVDLICFVSGRLKKLVLFVSLMLFDMLHEVGYSIFEECESKDVLVGVDEGEGGVFPVL